MKRTIIILLSLISPIARAQEPIMTNGYLLDANGSLEVLDTSVVTGSKSKDKLLDGKGKKSRNTWKQFMDPTSLGNKLKYDETIHYNCDRVACHLTGKHFRTNEGRRYRAVHHQVV